MTKHFLRAAVGAAAVVGLGVGATGALADGYYVGSVKDTTPIPAPVAYEWNGLSVGAGIGVGRFDQDAYGKAWRKDKKQKNICTKWKHVNYWPYLKCDKYIWKDYAHKEQDLESGSDSNDWNVFGTVQVGYDHLIRDRLLIGAFADFDFYNDADVTFSDKDGKNWLSGKVERDNMWTVGGRLGYLVTPRILLYGVAGYSQMKLNGSLDAHFDAPWWGVHPHSNPSIKLNDRVDGWMIGGGVEAKLEKRLSLKFEYRYSQFDGASASTSSGQDWKTFHVGWDKYRHKYNDGAKLDLGDTDVHSVRAVLSFKLGRDEEPIAPLK